jgi:indolepyruvate ferredoxin oxidoreductase, alpha subunit
VSYVGGYQGAPVSHLLDVMVEAKDLLAELGVHVETCTNEAAAQPCSAPRSIIRCAAR